MLAKIYSRYYRWLVRGYEIEYFTNIIKLRRVDQYGNISLICVTDQHVSFTCGVTGDVVLYDNITRTTYRQNRFPVSKCRHYWPNLYIGLWQYLQERVIVNTPSTITRPDHLKEMESC